MGRVQLEHPIADPELENILKKKKHATPLPLHKPCLYYKYQAY